MLPSTATTGRLPWDSGAPVMMLTVTVACPPGGKLTCAGDTWTAQSAGKSILRTLRLIVAVTLVVLPT